MKQKMKKPRIILVPYPALGHIRPMQKLATTFLSHGFEPVIVFPQYIHKQILLDNINVDYINNGDDHDDDEIKLVALSDGLEEDTTAPDFFGIESIMENNMPIQLEELLLHKYNESDDDNEGKVVCVVADLMASWAIQVANKCNIPAAGFWPAMLATYRLIAAIPDLLLNGLISADTGLPQREGQITFIPDMPILSTEDLPWLIGTNDAQKARFKFWLRTLERSKTLTWLFVNSFPCESKLDDEQETLLLDQGCPSVRLISHIGRNQLPKNLSFWEEDLSCLKWLANQEANSVVYISFGSWVNPIGEENLKSLALALEASGRPFIWVLRSNWQQSLPIGFLENVFKQGKGLVVSWAPQMEILQHNSIGCYITHCGWNSTLEALQTQKRLLCYPVSGDQFVNCAYIVQVWKIGLKLNGLGHKDIEEGLTKVMEDNDIDTRLMKLHERIMGMQGDNAMGSFMLKSFVEDLKKKGSTIQENASC